MSERPPSFSPKPSDEKAEDFVYTVDLQEEELKSWGEKSMEHCREMFEELGWYDQAIPAHVLQLIQRVADKDIEMQDPVKAGMRDAALELSRQGLERLFWSVANRMLPKKDKLTELNWSYKFLQRLVQESRNR